MTNENEQRQTDKLPKDTDTKVCPVMASELSCMFKAKFIFSLKRPHMFLNNINEHVSTALTQK